MIYHRGRSEEAHDEPRGRSESPSILALLKPRELTVRPVRAGHTRPAITEHELAFLPGTHPTDGHDTESFVQDIAAE